jgi:hypothetical protein
MFDRIKDQVMTRHYTKMKEASKFTGPICPKSQKKLSKHIEWSHDCYVEGARDGLFKVAARFSSTLMTHKYRGCIVVLSINKSVEPNKEQKVLMSGFDQGITINTSKEVFRGIW